jgi:hypothetical protein
MWQGFSPVTRIGASQNGELQRGDGNHCWSSKLGYLQAQKNLGGIVIVYILLKRNRNCRNLKVMALTKR